MFKKWLESQEQASWDQLLKALRSRSVQLSTLASRIENMLIGNGKGLLLLQIVYVITKVGFSLH